MSLLLLLPLLRMRCSRLLSSYCSLLLLVQLVASAAAPTTAIDPQHRVLLSSSSNPPADSAAPLPQCMRRISKPSKGRQWYQKSKNDTEDCERFLCMKSHKQQQNKLYHREWRAKNRKYVQNRQREWCQKNREEVNRRQRERYAKNREEMKRRQREQYAKNRDEVKRRRIEWRTNNRQDLNMKKREWWAKNKEEVNKRRRLQRLGEKEEVNRNQGERKAYVTANAIAAPASDKAAALQWQQRPQQDETLNIAGFSKVFKGDCPLEMSDQQMCQHMTKRKQHWFDLNEIPSDESDADADVSYQHRFR